MDKEQLYQMLADSSNVDSYTKIPFDIEASAKKYPYFAALQFASFGFKSQPETNHLSHLAHYKGDPYLFACFIQQMANRPIQTTETNAPPVTEDILMLINELPNTNHVEAALSLPHTIHSQSVDIEENIDISEDNELFQLPIKNRFETYTDKETAKEEDKSLMVMMSFTDWLFHFKNKTAREKQEEKEKKALKTAWQKEKLAAATEEENEEIPEDIFKQAMDSISENAIISESLAIILGKQGKIDKAIDMYKKLSLRNPEKNLYFADRIKELTTIKDY
ncbi:MAG: hypothetical protein IPL09_02620 [Bacteroidetes bacterium]|nr:hypothetical protein [Bacteroidota bacterium]MBK8328379.1 hypothetical protein [Bacteroidota bacterium]MBK9482785.1 hypothetical protein [Bacteroidota bacterium]